MKRAAFYALIGIALACCLLAPGVWWGDSLNAYIQGITGVYSAGQPVLMALLCTLTSHIIPGSLPIFIVCVILYFSGFALMVFGNVHHRIWAPVVFFGCSFFPILFATIGVVQTEAIQLGTLSLFIPLTIFLYRYDGKWKTVFLILLAILLCIFYLARYDAIMVAVILCYWLAYSYTRVHNRKTIFITAGVCMLFYISAESLDRIAGIEEKSEMKISLFVTDMAAISAQSGIDYIPPYCWASELPASDRTVQKIQYGLIHWKSSFYSYIYNIDPSIGLFKYVGSAYRYDVTRRWIKVVCRHPLLYVKYHLMVFKALVTGDNYDMGLWSGLILSHQNNARIAIDFTDSAYAFIQKHQGKYIYRDGYLTYKDNTPITNEEENELFILAGERRHGDVTWMQWYSNIPHNVYHHTNPIAEKFVLPAMENFKVYFKCFSIMLPYFLALAIFLIFYRTTIVDSFYRLSFSLLCLAGFIHIALRLVIITDPVFRLGIVSIFLLFSSFILLVADRLKSKGHYLPKFELVILSIGEAVWLLLMFSKILFPKSYLFRLLRIEKIIFTNLVNDTKGMFPHIYYIHTITIYSLALVGLVVLIRSVFIPFIRKSISGVIMSYRRDKQKTIGQFLIALLFIIPSSVVLAKEYQLRSLSYYPGSCYPGNDFSEDNPVISWTLLADSRGMNYFNTDTKIIGNNVLMKLLNHQGFFSPFDYDRNIVDSLSGTGPGRKSKQLFLGDSFLEGVGASVHDSSFIEIYRRNNTDKLVCSTGIGGMDPVQYRLVAEKYIPDLKPDEVIVMFCGWNDIMWMDRQPVPYLPVLTDIPKVGVIYNYIPAGVASGDTMTLWPDKSYRLYRKRFSLMENTGFWPGICRKTCLTTQIYYALNPVKYYPVKLHTDSMATYRNLKRIKDLTDSTGAKFTIVFIPTPPMKDYGPAEYEAHFKWVFGDLWPYVHLCPRGTITANECSTSMDYHFNDNGQKKFAEYLKKELSQ